MRHKILLICLCGFLLTGCWDNVEIQERGYVFSVAIDKAYPIPKGFDDNREHKAEKKLEEFNWQHGEPQYAFTLNLPIFSASKQAATGEAGGGATEPSWDITLLGNSFLEVSRHFATRMNFEPFYEHLQAIVISEEVAREGITKPLDFFLRNYEMRRRTRIFVSVGEAKQILDVQPRIETFPALYLIDIPENAEITTKIVHVTDLGEVSENIHQGSNFILPQITATEDEMQSRGAAVFKQNHMVGWIDGNRLKYTQWIRNLVRGGELVIKNPQNPEELIAVEILRARTKVRPIVKEGMVNMKIDVSGTFNIDEIFSELHTSAFEDAFIKNMEKELAQYLKTQMQDTIRHVQKELRADIFFFDLQMRRYEPKLWKEIEDQWEDIFVNMDPEINVKVRIKQVGTMK